MLIDERLRFFHTQNGNIRAARVLCIHADVLAKLLGVTGHVQNIVADLERQTDVQLHIPLLH